MLFHHPPGGIENSDEHVGVIEVGFEAREDFVFGFFADAVNLRLDNEIVGPDDGR